MNICIRNLFPLKTPNHDALKHYLYHVIWSLISVGLAALLLRGLVSYSDPAAALHHFQLKVNDNSTTIAIDTQVINNNLFRGFNFTEGWIEIFYVPNNSISEFLVEDAIPMEITYKYIELDYAAPRSNTLKWSFKWDTADDDDVNTTSVNYTNLKKNKSHFYVSIYMGYWYKILSWTTNTVYYQWLDAHVFVDYKEDVGTYTAQMTPLPFKRMKDFNWAVSA